MPSNVKTAYAMINGQKFVATYSEETQLWTVEGTGPAESSWNQPNHVYAITLHAEDNAGNTVSMDSTDETYGDQLKLRVLEKTKPTATIVSPTQDSVLGSSTQNIVMELSDAGNSGLNMDTVVFKVNGSTISTGLTWNDGEDGKKTCTYVATDLPDGSNTISLQVTDNDGNVSDTATVTFVISTAAPNLTVTTPTEGLITNSNKVTVSGVATPGSDVVSIASVTINGDAVEVEEGGNFSKEITLESEGNNAITVIATDSLGKTTQIIRNVLLDTKAPVITDVVAEATTIDANSHFKITFKVVDQ